MVTSTPDLVVLYEHPEWQKPLFAALERRGVSYERFNVSEAAFSNQDAPAAHVYFNQASPSAYIRGHARAVPLAVAYMRSLERQGARVLNGAEVFALELSKSTQATLLRTLDIDTPFSITFNDVAALSHTIPLEEIEAVFRSDPNVWLPDNLFLLQEFLPHDPDQGIVRMEFLGGELLYAMRVKTHGRFNLCPSPVCNPEEGEGACEVPEPQTVLAPPVEFYPYVDVPHEAVEIGKRIVRAARLDVGGIEYLETNDGRRVFYDINANSNLRPSVAAAWGFDPFDRVVDFLVQQLVGAESSRA
jgi:hypothetical protein